MAAASVMQTPSTARIRLARRRFTGAAAKRTWPDVPRISRRAATLASAATGIAQAASSNATWVSYRATATATGIASTATRPNTTARDGRPLLLCVRAANSCGRDGAADHAGDRDEGQDVRQRLEEHGRGVGVRRETEREGRRRAEENRGCVRAEGPPVAEDDRSERDEAASRRHVLAERADEADREVRAAERRENPGDDDRDVARQVDGDADRVRRTRMLAHRAQPQSDRRVEDDDLRDDQES